MDDATLAEVEESIYKCEELLKLEEFQNLSPRISPREEMHKRPSPLLQDYQERPKSLGGSPSSFEKKFEGEIRSLQLQDTLLTDAVKQENISAEEFDCSLEDHSDELVSEHTVVCPDIKSDLACKEWLHFKTEGCKTNSESGPEEIVSSTYSQVAGSSRFETPVMNKQPMGTEQKICNRHSKEAILKQQEEEMRREFTFQPKLVARRKSSSQTQGEARIEQLSQPRNIKLLVQYAIDKEAEEAALFQECSFRPKTGRPPEQKTPAKPVEERLFHAYENQNLNRTRCMLQKEEEALIECTFCPATNSNKIKLKNYVPLPERALLIQQDKRERLSRMKEEKDATFSPAINQRSRRLALMKEKKEIGIIANSRFDIEFLQENQEKKSMDPARDSYDCTFAPEINSFSKRLVERSTIPQNFISRQEYFVQEKRRKQLEAQLQLEEKECTFVPQINNTEEVLAASKFVGRLQEDRKEMAERLARKDPESRAAKAELLKESISRSYTFKPDINPISKLIGKHRTTEDLYEEGKERQVYLQKRRQDELTNEQANKAKVSIPKKKPIYSSSRPQTAPTDKRTTAEELFRRAEKQSSILAQKKDELKRQEARRELQECTFSPNIKYGVPRSKGPVVVRGIGRYLQLQQNAQRMKHDQDQRETKIFKRHPKGNHSKFTIPIPFALGKQSI